MGLKVGFNGRGKRSKNVDGFRKVLEEQSIKMCLYGGCGVKKGGDMVLKWWEELVGVDRGKLKGCGKVVKIRDSRSSGRMVYEVEYEGLGGWGNSSGGSFNYGWIEDEDLSLGDGNGGEGKYLEQGYRCNKELLMRIIKEGRKKGMGVG